MQKVLAIAALVSLAGCGGSSPSDEGPSEALMIVAGQDAVRGILRDPDSAEFRNSHIVKYQGRSVLCGEVNAKNGFGGMSGFERFVTNGGEATALESQVTDFDVVWTQMGC